MSGPRIHQTDDEIGFHWVSERGEPTALPEVISLPDSEVERLLPTHLEALDDVLIAAAGRFGEVLGGARRPADSDEERQLVELHRAIDRLCHEYAAALAQSGLSADIRAGQIVGTAFLIGLRARMAVGLDGPPPLDVELDDPEMGVVAGFGELAKADETRPWRGARWIVRTESGRRYPATLSMLLFDSSGVNKDAALDEHREALLALVASGQSEDADPLVVACAVDWLLYDWLMAHRDGKTGAVEVRQGRDGDAAMIIAAASASASARATMDPGLLDVPR